MNLKKVLAFSLAMLLCFSLAACGGGDSGSSAGGDDAASYTIGFNTWGAGTPTFDVMGDEIEYTLKTYGLKGSRLSDDHMADKELQNIQNFISSGVDGIAMQATADPVLPQAADACADAEMPFVLDIFVGDDADREEIRNNNDFYVGAVSADLYLDGYLMGQCAAADGHKTAVLVGGNIGDNHMEQRIAGFTKSFVEEGGGEILDDARCSSPAESQEKSSALLSANRDADCIYAMVGDYCPGAINAMESLGLEMAVYVSNAGSDTVDYIRDGRVSAGGGGNDLPAGIAVALLVNYLDGHPILDDAGLPPDLLIKPFVVTRDNVEDYVAMFYSGDGLTHPVTEDVLNTLVWRSNENVSYKTFEELVTSGLTLEKILEAHSA